MTENGTLLLNNFFYILRQKLEIHPLFPLVDILYYNSLLLYIIPIIVAIICLVLTI